MIFTSLPLTRFFADGDRDDAKGGSAAARRMLGGRDEPAPLSSETVAARTRVLIVDDDPMIRSSLSEALRHWGYRPSEAGSVAEALELVRRERPAATVISLKLPDGSGMRVLNEIKRQSPKTVIIVIAGYESAGSAFDAAAELASGFVTKPIDHEQLRVMLREALSGRLLANQAPRPFGKDRRSGELKRGRPQGQTVSPLGKLILQSMKLLGLSYKHIVSESNRLATLNENPDMRIGKSTLGNIISGRIRQASTAKLDSLRIILHLSRAEMDAAIGLQPERRFAEQLETSSARTHQLTRDAVTRQRTVRMPIMLRDASLIESQFLAGIVERWASVEVEYLGPIYPLHLVYVIVGEDDTYASPVAPPGTRLLVNTLLTEVRPAENVSYHERELFYVLTPQRLTCSYLENAPGGKIVLVPHPLSGHVREEFKRGEVTIIGKVVGLLFRK
ncbi:MAG: response regulator [Pyrinomonadaceae bacterium]